MMLFKRLGRARLAIFVTSALFMAACLGNLAYAHKGATGIVKERMDLFKQNQSHLRDMRRLIAAEDFASIASKADDIAIFADHMPDYFPAGSDQSPSEASPRIWQEFDEFRSAAAANAMAARQLASAARAADREAVLTALALTGASCKSCHKSFKK